MESIDELDLSQTYTYADYYSWRFEDRVELIKGKVFKMGDAPGGNHQLISGNIAGELHQFLKGKRVYVFMAPFDIRLARGETADEYVKTVVQPDISVICDISKLSDQRSCFGSPDIVVEVLSTEDNIKEVKIKYELYEEFGVKEYWLVYPDERSLIQYVLTGEGKFEHTCRPMIDGDILTTPILPGFELALDDVFRDLL